MKLFKIILIVVLVLVIGAGATFYFGKDALGFNDEKKDKSKTAEQIAELSIDTDVITTNLKSNHFAIVQFNILLNSKEAMKEIELRKPEVRAAIISTIASFTKDDLTGNEGIDKLEKEMTTKFGKMTENGKVERVLVTEFKVQ